MARRSITAPIWYHRAAQTSSSPPTLPCWSACTTASPGRMYPALQVRAPEGLHVTVLTVKDVMQGQEHIIVVPEKVNRAGVTSSSLKSREFMKRYASIADTMTAGGYNPLLQDFTNTSFFVGQTW